MGQKKKKIKRTDRDRVENYLTKYRDILNISQLEKKFQFPKGSIQNYVKDGRPILDTRIKVLDHFLLDVAYEYIDEDED